MKPRKHRVELRRNRSGRRRSGDLTRAAASDPDGTESLPTEERLTGKGGLTRKRTVVGIRTEGRDALPVAPAAAGSWLGRVLHVHGLVSHVERPGGGVVRCTTRRLLKTMLTRQRTVVTAGDRVDAVGDGEEGVITAIHPRTTALSRTSRGRLHVIVANVDQVIIVGSAAEPNLKPGLLDRLIVAAETAAIRPIICLNKVDLVDPAGLVPLAGLHARMGYPAVLCSTVTGMGVARLAAELPGRVTAVVGQSGVGKSSLINALSPGLDLRVAEVSRENEKGRHTTTTARLLPHSLGGHFVDTPGIRQFQLWEVVAAEAAASFRDIRPFANRCRYPDCTHTHESFCAVKDAVADGLLDTGRWETCCQLVAEGAGRPGA